MCWKNQGFNEGSATFAEIFRHVAAGNTVLSQS